MADKPLTPERQLLNLIEGNAQEPSVKSEKALKTEAIRHQGLSLVSAGAWSGRISFYKEEWIKWIKGGGFRKIEISTVNRILSAVIFILAAYFIISFSLSVSNYRKVPDFTVKAKIGAKIADIQEMTILKAAPYYLEKVRSRNLFLMGKTVIENEKGAQVSPSRAAEMTQNLRLVGISWSSDPDVMLEDTKSLKTYFLKKGQIVEPLNVKVQAVFKDKVILSYEGAEIELK